MCMSKNVGEFPTGLRDGYIYFWESFKCYFVHFESTQKMRVHTDLNMAYLVVALATYVSACLNLFVNPSDGSIANLPWLRPITMHFLIPRRICQARRGWFRNNCNAIHHTTQTSEPFIVGLQPLSLSQVIIKTRTSCCILTSSSPPWIREWMIRN